MRWSATGEEHRSWVEHMIGRQRRGGGTLRLRPRPHGVWNGGRGLIIFSENTPQKEFQNSQLCSCWRNRSNKFLFRLYANVASLKQNHERRAPTRTFPLKFCSAIPAAADGDAAARCTCPAYLLRVGSFPVLLFSSSCSQVFLSLHLNYSVLSLVIRRPVLAENKCPAGKSKRTDRLMDAFVRHVASIRRQQGAELTSAGR